MVLVGILILFSTSGCLDNDHRWHVVSESGDGTAFTSVKVGENHATVVTNGVNTQGWLGITHDFASNNGKVIHGESLLCSDAHHAVSNFPRNGTVTVRIDFHDRGSTETRVREFKV